MKTILILGGFGFLGSNIIDYVDNYYGTEYQFIVVDRIPKHPSGQYFKAIKKIYCGDVSNESFLESVFYANHIDIVIHTFTATIPAQDFDASFDIEANLLPTVKILDIMTKYDVRNIVYISSGGAIYGESTSLRHKEDEDVFPISTYGVTKLATEKYLMLYAKSYGLRPLILRLTNPYGRYHYSTRQGICNIALSHAINGEVFHVWGDGEATKDYIFVEDFVQILMRLISKGVHTTTINIASGKMISVNNILGTIKNLIPSFEWDYCPASKFDVKHFSLDTSKMTSIIGHYDFTPFEDGLKQTFIWEKRND